MGFEMEGSFTFRGTSYRYGSEGDRLLWLATADKELSPSDLEWTLAGRFVKEQRQMILEAAHRRDFSPEALMQKCSLAVPAPERRPVVVGMCNSTAAQVYHSLGAKLVSKFYNPEGAVRRDLWDEVDSKMAEMRSYGDDRQQVLVTGGSDQVILDYLQNMREADFIIVVGPLEQLMRLGITNIPDRDWTPDDPDIGPMSEVLDRFAKRVVPRRTQGRTSLTSPPDSDVGGERPLPVPEPVTSGPDSGPDFDDDALARHAASVLNSSLDDDLDQLLEGASKLDVHEGALGEGMVVRERMTGIVGKVIGVDGDMATVQFEDAEDPNVVPVKELVPD